MALEAGRVRLLLTAVLRESLRPMVSGTGVVAAIDVRVEGSAGGFK